jgi:hypothetical protein
MRAATEGLTMPNSTEQIVREINALWPNIQEEPIQAAA